MSRYHPPADASATSPAYAQASLIDRPGLSRGVRGFTLVELLVVIGIIALLISILLPTLNKVRESAKATQCMANLRTIGQCYFLYTNANKGRGMIFAYDVAPPAGMTSAQQYWFGGVSVLGVGTSATYTWDVKQGYLMAYLHSEKFLNCPSAAEYYNAYVGGSLKNVPVTTYAYNATASVPFTNPANPYLLGGGAATYAGITAPAETMALMDAMNVDGLGTPTACYVSEQPGRPNADGSIGNKIPNFQGRHGDGFGNVLWYDGHATSLRPYITKVAANYLYAYPATIEMCKKAKVGYLTPLTKNDTPETSLISGAMTNNVNYYYWAKKKMRR
ncbi:MAG: prepilin-type N-terminal cleavage/methylation domain-containing protein [Tepidisphaeraceae bacterium]